MKWNRPGATAAGLALLALTNAVALGGAAWNRMGEPDSRLQLSERELAAPWDYGSPHAMENSGLSLQLRWRCLPVAHRLANGRAYFDFASPAWLDARKMADLGFDTRNAGAGRGLLMQREAREVWLVLELGGPSFRASQAAVAAASAASGANRTPSPINEDWYPNKDSRLFVVDAGLDRTALRAQYADRAMYAIVRGRVAPRREDEGKVQGGRIDSLSIDEVNVPLALRPVFDGIRPRYAEAAQVRFDATVVFGRRAEPWLADARRALAAPASR